MPKDITVKFTGIPNTELKRINAFIDFILSDNPRLKVTYDRNKAQQQKTSGQGLCILVDLSAYFSEAKIIPITEAFE
jgi:hypothetical protein